MAPLPAGGVQARRGAHLGRRHAGDCLGRLGRVAPARATNVFHSSNDFGVAALGDVVLGDQAFGDDDVRQRVDQGDVGAGPQLQVVVGLDVRRVAPGRSCADRRRSACAPSRRRRFMREANTGWPSVGLAPITMITSAFSTESKVCVPADSPSVCLQAVAGRRVADARAGVDVVVAERGAHQLLHQVGFFVGAARRGDAADRVAAVLRLDALELAGGVVDRLVPAHFLPRVGDLLADHRLGDAVLVRGVAPGEAALDAGVAVVGLAVLLRHHAHDFVALHLGLERAADAAVGAGGDDAVLGLAELDDRLSPAAWPSGRPARRRRRTRIPSP